MKVFTICCVSVLSLGLLSCNTPPPKPKGPEQGLWRFALQMNEVELPFQAEYTLHEGVPNFVVYNAEERITVDEIEQRDDSLIIRMPIFNSIFWGKMESPTQVQGIYQDYSRGKSYRMPFEAQQGDSSRFIWPETTGRENFEGRWRMEFSPETDSAFPAIGIFQQNEGIVSGTILTETGDYRYLEGSAEGTQLRLSAFDGSHAFLFHGNLRNDSLFGNYYSGIHWEENWIAVRDENAELRDPESLTFLKPGYSEIAFSFPDTDSTLVSLEDPQFQDKAIIVQLMGTWCPNCMDESKFYSQLYKSYKDQGLEIVALAYERQAAFDDAVKNIDRLAQRFGIEYEILLAGTDDKSSAAKSLPMLNHIMSFPTSIFIDKKRRVRKIHTGFNGPGTGALYTRFVDDTQQLVEKMLAGD